MRWIITILLAFSLSKGNAQLRDYDKHYIAGVVIGAITIPIAHHFGARFPEGWSMVAGLAAGLGKEGLDHYLHRQNPETEEMNWDHISDTFATVSGAVTVTIVIGPILSHKRKNRYLFPEYK